MPRTFRPALAALVLSLGLIGPSHAASARDELLGYLPEDVGFCLVVQDLRGHSTRLLASPFAKALRDSPLISVLASSNEWKQLLKFQAEMKQALGLDWAGLRDDILGDAFVFAYRPGSAGKTDQDQGLFLIRARNAKTLSNLISKLNKAQKDSGELKSLTEKEHKGIKYTCRVEKKEKTFYLLSGSTLLFTGQEAMLQKAIETNKALAADALPPLTRRLKALGLDKAPASLLVNPRAFDAAITAVSGKKAAGKALLNCWKALQGIAVSLEVARDFRLSLTLQAKSDQLPASARKILTTAGQANPLWSVVPDKALVAIAGRIDLSAMHGLVGLFMSKTSKETLDDDLERLIGAVLGKNVVKEVLPAIGPDWAAWLLPPKADSKTWTPRGLLAIKVARGDENDPVDEAVISAIKTWAQLAIVAHNKQHPTKPIRLKTSTLDKIKIRHLTGDKVFPDGIQPAWALKGGYLLLATSPAEISAFRAPQAAKTTSTVPLVQMSFKNWRAYLKEHRQGLAKALAAKEEITAKKALDRLDALRGNMELFERLVLSQKSATGQVTWTLSLIPVKGLQKAE